MIVRQVIQINSIINNNTRISFVFHIIITVNLLLSSPIYGQIKERGEYNNLVERW